MIRRAQFEDRNEIFVLAKEFATSFEVEENSFRTSFDLLIRDPNTYLALAEVDSCVVGYILCFKHSTFYANGSVTWIEEITVDKTHRRKGIGKSLMQSAEEWAKEKDCRLVALATRRAADFYKSMSYQESATYFRKLL